MNETGRIVNSTDMNNSLTRYSVLLLLSTLVGCATNHDYAYSESQEAIYLAEIKGDMQAPAGFPTIEINDEVKAELDRRIKSHWSDRHKLDVLRDLMFDEDALNIQYDSNDTKTAMEIWQARRGNCLSMTNLFVAMARYVGLNAWFQTVEVRPTWNHEGEMMIRYEHIIGAGRMSAGEYVIDFLPEFVLDEGKAERISDGEALALYYNNLGAESLVDGDVDRGLSNLQKSLVLEDGDSDAWNNMGAAQRRNGRDDLAEFAWQRAVKLDARNYSALNNLAQFYEARGRLQEAKEYAGRVAYYRARNPYFHYFIAQYLFERGEYENTIRYLESAVRLKDDEPDFYAALSRTHNVLGNERQAGDYESLAAQYSIEDIEQARRVNNHRFLVGRAILTNK